MTRLNITIPDDVAEGLNHVKNKSRFIAEAVRECFEREHRRQIETLLAEGYKKTAQEDRKVVEEWDRAASEEGWK